MPGLHLHIVLKSIEGDSDNEPMLQHRFSVTDTCFVAGLGECETESAEHSFLMVEFRDFN